jgi:YVTN family beta-propeller protein
MKTRTKQGLIKRVNSRSSITTRKASVSGPFYQVLHKTIGQHLSIALFLVFPLGVGLGTAAAQAQIRAYVTNASSDTVSVIDTATNTVVATVPVGLFPFKVAITPDGTRAYVTNYNSKTVSIMDTATNTVVATIPVGIEPVGVAITPDGTRAYVTDPNPFTVAVIDTATNTVVATIPVGLTPLGVAITPAPQTPKSKEQCKHGGYKKFGPPAGPFRNQGQCVSYVERH